MVHKKETNIRGSPNLGLRPPKQSQRVTFISFLFIKRLQFRNIIFPYFLSVVYPSYPNAAMCEKRKIYTSLLLQNESVPLVADFQGHFNEACSIKMSNYTYCKITLWQIRNPFSSMKSQTCNLKSTCRDRCL